MDDKPRRTALDPVALIRRRLERLAAGSRLSLAWERLWPRLWAPISVVLLFLAVSWFGLWLHLPWWGRAGGAVLFAAAFVASFWPIIRDRWPSRREALARLDRSMAGAHRPATALEDSLAVGGRDPVSQALWKLHLHRQSEHVAALKVSAPRPLMAGRDRLALRAAPLLAAVTGFFIAGHEVWPRLSAAFDWRGPAAATVPVRIDAWIDPPAYTRLPPILIDFSRLASPRFNVPEKSTVVVRIAGRSAMDVATTGRLDALPADDKAAPAGAGKPSEAAVAVLEKRYLLAGDGTLRITGSGAPAQTLSLHAVIDAKPEIAFV